MSALEAARKDWAAGRGSSSEGVYLLRQAKRVETLLPGDALITAEQALLSLVSGRFEETKDFTALVDLADLSPALFTPPHRSLKSWGSEFKDFLVHERSWLLYDLDDPDWLDEQLGAIHRVAEALTVDITKLAAEVEERGAELRYEAESEHEDDDWHESDSAPAGASPEAEVDALFQSLL